MEFVRLENEDGDSVYASFFEAINHPDTDIQFIDQSTGETWEAQLKATDSISYVEDWIKAHPDGEILVTEELAEKMGLPSSEISNEELTVRVEDFVDKMVSDLDTDALWDYFPVLSVISVSFVVWELWRRHKQGEIDGATFKRLAARVTGLKIAKISSIVLLLSIPVIGQIIGVALMANLLFSAKTTFFDKQPIHQTVPQQD
jgi:hypothetical protein